MQAVKEKVDHFTKLDAWRVAHELVLGVYRVTRSFPTNERFGIIDQLRRAVASIAANIAEGWGRFHFADKIRFYYQARGSTTEVQNFLILSKDLGYLREDEFRALYEQSVRCISILGGLIRSAEKQFSR